MPNSDITPDTKRYVIVIGKASNRKFYFLYETPTNNIRKVEIDRRNLATTSCPTVRTPRYNKAHASRIAKNIVKYYLENYPEEEVCARVYKVNLEQLQQSTIEKDSIIFNSKQNSRGQNNDLQYERIDHNYYKTFSTQELKREIQRKEEKEEEKKKEQQRKEKIVNGKLETPPSVENIENAVKYCINENSFTRDRINEILQKHHHKDSTEETRDDMFSQVVSCLMNTIIHHSDKGTPKQVETLRNNIKQASINILSNQKI